MTELVTSGSVGGMASNGCLYPENLLDNCPIRRTGTPHRAVLPNTVHPVPIATITQIPHTPGLHIQPGYGNIAISC